MGRHEEVERLDALQKLNLLDTTPAESFDRITRMASQIFNLPVAAISLTDHDRQWFKSRVGIDHHSIPRDRAPCAEVAETTQPLVISNFLDDEIYRDSPLASSGVRFYAGVPLTTHEGFGLGALCVLGTEARDVTPSEMASLQDLAAMVMAQIELQHAFGRIDPLSGLPNRFQFFEDLQDLASEEGSGTPRLLVLLDLARTEQIEHAQQVMGSLFVDEMVRTAVRQLRAALTPKQKAYHVGSTQFAWLAPIDADEKAYLSSLSKAVEAAQLVEHVGFLTTAAIGVAPFHPDRADPSDVLRTAFSAVTEARSTACQVSLYSVERDNEHRRRYRIINDFGTALEGDDQLFLVFQPRIDLVTGACVGTEALLRWEHPELGSISPAEFVPIIERTRFASATTRWVLERSLAQLAQWRARGFELCVSVNISANNLEEPDFVEAVLQAVLRHPDLPFDALELEVTETAVMMDSAGALARLKALSAAGVSLAIDDFGTGYSSLAYLQRLPTRTVKIDRSFIAELGTNDRDLTLVQTMITLAHELGYRVVAEGIERAGTASLLASIGCDEGQGYFYARPIRPNQFEDWHLGFALIGADPRIWNAEMRDMDGPD